MTLAEAITTLENRFKVLAKTEFRGDTALTVEREQIVEVCTIAKKELGFDMLHCICAVDNFGSEPRFEVVYELYSLANNCYLRLKVAVSEEDCQVPSVTSIWKSADWFEREVYDMMGVRFAGHPDLRRILMWDGYPYHPMRKDFPLAGRPTEVPDVAFTKAAPLEGGPYVTTPCTAGAREREPRSKRFE